MLKRFHKTSGNKYTLISIIMIMLMIYFFKIALGGGEEGNYPQNVYHGDNKFQYSQTISESSLKFIRKYGVSYEGHNLLIKRGESWDTVPSRVYIFIGWKKYREYELIR
ncbi:MAG: hypothetical protein K0Q65_588 [Clostridia bacterium]|nr:hypothetical protein [Clostridia bacterium]